MTIGGAVAIACALMANDAAPISVRFFLLAIATPVSRGFVIEVPANPPPARRGDSSIVAA